MADSSRTICTVADVAAPTKNSLVGGPFGSDLVSKDYVPSGVPVIRGINMGQGRWVNGDFAYVTKEKAESLSANCAKPGDLIFTQRGTLGQVAIVPDHRWNSYLISQSQMKLSVDASKADAMFLYYVFTSGAQQEYIRQNAIQTGVPHTNLGILRNTPLRLPPLSQQKEIASTLGALDDKIEANSRLKATLDAVARLIFQSWFVDFDPVRAKSEGRSASAAPAKAALFPETFQDSALGLIPKGWTAIPLYDTAQYVNGAAFKTEDFCATGDGLPVIKIGELKNGISNQTKWSQRRADESQMIETGDLLYSWSGSPDTSLEAFLWANGPGLLNQHIFKVVTDTPARKHFVFYLLHHLRPILVETARNKQTTGLGHVTVADMKRITVCWPGPAILSAFDELVGPIFNRAFATILESRLLAEARDALLPRLIQGDVSERTSS